jgi:hypothetical protein
MKMTQEEREQAVKLFKSAGITRDGIWNPEGLANRFESAVVLFSGDSPLLIIPVSDRALRHSFERQIATGTMTRAEAFTSLDYGMDYLILVKPEVHNGEKYGDDEDWKWMSEQLPRYYPPVEKGD